jgi:hypothetical protein
MTKVRLLALVATALLPVAITACPNKDKDDATTGAPPTPVPTAAPTPTPTTTLVVEDAGTPVPDAGDAGVDAHVVTGTTSLTKCCNAIKQNAKSAPPEQQLIYQGAIAICNSGAIPPQFRNLPQCK